MTAGRSSERSRLGRAFFDRPTVRVARALLGCLLQVRAGRTTRSVRLVETEAYVRGDPANHTYRGPTPRSRAMYGPPGTLYVYRIHQVVCANLVTRPGEAVLLRAGEAVEAVHCSATGPGRLCRALGIALRDNGIDTTRGRRITVVARAVRPRAVAVGPRVGVARAVERRLRFTVEAHPAVSRPRIGRRPAPSGSSPSRSRGGGPWRRTRTRRRRPSAGGTSAARTAGR